MIEIAGMQVSDFNSKCSGSIMKVDGNLFLFDGTSRALDQSEEDGEERIYGKCLSRDGEKWRAKRYTLREIQRATVDLTFPPVGYVNYQIGAVYLSRVSARQWKLGFNPRVLRGEVYFKVEWNALNHNSPNMNELFKSTRFIQDAYNPTFPPWEEVVTGIREGQYLGRAISDKIYLGASMFYDGIVICYKCKVVGYITNADQRILFEDGDYIQQCLPFATTLRAVPDDTTS